MPAERRKLDPVDDLQVGRARLRELAGDAPELDDRQRGAVGEHRGHLQQHLQPLADRDRRDIAERLGAIARLEHEARAPRPPRRARGAVRAPRRRRRAAAAGRDGCGPRRARPGRATPAAGGRGRDRHEPGVQSIRSCHQASLDGGVLTLRVRTGSTLTSAKRSKGQHADLLRNPTNGRKDPRQLHRRVPPVRADAGGGRRLLLHRRPALDHRRLRPSRSPRADARPLRHARRDRPRSRPGRRSSRRATWPRTPRRAGCSHR